MPFHLLPNQMNLFEGPQPQLHHQEFSRLANSICCSHGVSLQFPYGMFAWALSSEQLLTTGESTDITVPDELDPDASKVQIQQRKQALKDAQAQLEAVPVITEDLLRAAGPTCRAALSHPIYGTTRLTSTEIIDWCLFNCRDFQEGNIETLELRCATLDQTISLEANLADYKIAHSQLEEQQAGLSPMKKLSLLKSAMKGTRLDAHLIQFIYANPVLSKQSYEKLSKFLQRMDHAMPLSSPATTASHFAAAAVTTSTTAAAASTDAFKKLEATVAALEAKLKAQGAQPRTGDRNSTPKGWLEPCSWCVKANVADPVPKYGKCRDHNRRIK